MNACLYKTLPYTESGLVLIHSETKRTREKHGKAHFFFSKMAAKWQNSSCDFHRVGGVTKEDMLWRNKQVQAKFRITSDYFQTTQFSSGRRVCSHQEL